VCLLVQNGLRTLLGGGALGGGGAPTGLIAPGATHPRYVTAGLLAAPNPGLAGLVPDKY
jgi:hypothetical protein